MQFRSVLFLVLSLLSVCSLPVFGQNKFYIGNEQHTDYFWIADAARYRTAYINQLDYYINLMETRNDTLLPQFQYRYNCDNSLWVYEYEKAKSAVDFQRLIKQIKSDHITVPFNLLVPLYGGQNAELAIRGMYYGGYLQRKYGIEMNMAVMMENQTFPLGINSLWARAGAKYSWKGVCDCGSPIRDLNNRKYNIYYSRGTDGKGVLMKWYDFIGTSDLGGYVECAYPKYVLGKMNLICNTSKYPYSIAAAFGVGGDQLENYVDSLPAYARRQSNSLQTVIISNKKDFFQDFESKYANVIPSQAVTYGNDWDLLIATMAKVSGDVKRSAEKLRVAEAMASLVALKDTGFGQQLAAKRELAWISVGKYYDHDWTAEGIASIGRATFQRDMEKNFSSYVDTLYDLARAQLGTQIAKRSTNSRFYVFNPLGWERTEAADYQYAGGIPVKIIDVKTQLEVPSQIVTLNSLKYIRILAANIPAVGYKVFEIQRGTPASLPVAATFLDSVFENTFYKLTLSKNGSITSFLYKTDGNFQYNNSAAMNDFGSGVRSAGTLTVESSGPVSVTVNSTSSSPYTHMNRITLFKSVERVDIDDQLNHNILNTTVTYQFPVNISDPTVWHEEVGAVIKAKLETNGGQYAIQNARYDWQTANHFVYVGNSSRGFTISNLGANFFKLGKSTFDTLDEKGNNIQFLAAGRVAFGTLGINNQGGDQSFRYQYSLQPKTGAFNQRSSMKMSMEHQNPLVTGIVGGGSSYPDTSFSLLSITQPDVLLWSLKPSEEGSAKGIIARVWNQAGTGTVTMGGVLPILSAKNATHVETDISAATILNRNLQESIGYQEMKTFRLFFKDSILVHTSTSYTFTGNGNWNVAANWSNSTIPPPILPAGDVIMIDPVVGGECVLNIAQTVATGASLQVAAAKKFRIAGNLTITQ